MSAEQQGVQPERYQIIPRALVFAMRDGKLLLLKGAPTKRVWPNQYNGVGGHIERGEEVLSAAYREFKEETGLQLIDPWLAALVMIDTGQPIGIGMYIFRGLAGPGEPVTSAEGSLHWVSPEEIDDLDLVEDLPVLLPRVLDLQPGDGPLFAQYSYDDEDQLTIHFFNP